jgi:tetratricopeptide (TPR) repeat protein
MKIKLLTYFITITFSAQSFALEGQTSLSGLTQTKAGSKLNSQVQSGLKQLHQQEQSRLSYPIMDEMDAAIQQNQPPAKPDERVLWEMFHRGQFAVLQTELQRLHQAFPSWVPPEQFARARRSSSSKVAVGYAQNNHLHLQLAYFLAQDPNDPGVIFAREVANYQAGNKVTPSEKLVQLTESLKDVGVARLFAWNALNHKELEYAKNWFELALKWAPDDEDAHYGLALALFQAGKAEDALKQIATIRTVPATNLRGEIYFSQGLVRYQAADYSAAQQLFDQAREQGRHGRDIEMMQAWANLRLKQYDSALSTFTKLYQEKPDVDVAQGLLAAAQASGRQGELTRLIGDNSNDPLRLLINKNRHDFLQQQGWIWAAQAIDKQSEQAGISGPWVGLSMLGERLKSGESGLSRLQISQRPSVEGLFAYNNDIFRWRLTQLNLNSGALPTGAQFGSYGVSSKYVTQPTTQTNGLEPSARWRHEGDGQATQISIGTTMLAGPVKPTPVFEATYESVSETHNWSTSIYRNSVRDSLLSTTGAVDPYSGVAWGRVVRNGVSLQFSQMLLPKWRASAAIRAEQLSGEHVADNTHIGINASLSYDFGWDGFTYASIGPGISYDSYQQNLSHFTWGHGGYFSPQQFTNLGLSGQFLTKEGGRFVARGQAGVGFQHVREAGSPCFPLQPVVAVTDCGSYSATDKQGIGVNVEGLWKYAVTPHWQLGGGVSFRHSQDYIDTSVLFSLYYSWPARSHLYRADLPEWQLSELF